MLRKYYPWALFLAFLLLLLFSSTSFVKAMDWMLWPLRFGVLAGFSALLLWSRWRHHHNEGTREQGDRKDFADQMLTSARRWYHGEQK